MDLSSPFDASPEAALAAIGSHDGPLCVDLDETLYLRNSTEDFIDSASPAMPALMALRVLDTIKPWRWTGGEATRDTWRIRLISTFFPWTWLRWRSRVRVLARDFCNQELVSALRDKAGVVIVTLGFLPIVKPLVAALGFPGARLVAARVSSFEDRAKGKLHFALNELGQDVVGSSMFVTDSLDDLPLLAKCARPLRTIWPGARFSRALSRAYLPSEYVSRVKHPGQRYIWRVILQEDLAFWILSSVGVALHPWLHIGGLCLLLASFWTIYECGYVDNDWAAEHLESDGKLSHNYWHAGVATPTIQPWIWAAALGAAAIYLLDWPTFVPLQPAKWLGLLVATYATFKIYNRIDKTSRIWLFAALQFARSTAFMILVPVEPAGAAALGALVLSRWVPYYVYRTIGGDWPKFHTNLMRLLFFVVLLVITALTVGLNAILTWTTLALLLWNLYRARREVWSQLFAIRRIDRENAAP